MELRPGYKQTEVGPIPEDWGSSSVGDIAAFSSGIGINVAMLSPERSDARVPVYGGNGIAGYTTASLVLEPTIAIGRVGQKCGEVYLTDGPSWITDNALYPRKFHRRVSLQFFALALKSAGLNDFKNRNDLPLVTQAILHDAVIRVPSTLAEQEAIAEAMSDADALIESLEQLLAKKRQIKQGAMQELLTGKKRLPGFNEPWRSKSIGELGKPLKGRGVSRTDSASGNLPCIRYGEIYTEHDFYVAEYTSWISEEVAAGATQIKRGDLLFAGSGETKEEIGKCVAIVDDRVAYAGGDIVILRTSSENPVFLGYYLNTPPINRQKASRGQGDAVVHISSAALSEIECVLPKEPEQAAIAQVFREIDQEISIIEAKLSKARQLKQGMMQELLTGRIRLV